MKFYSKLMTPVLMLVGYSPLSHSTDNYISPSVQMSSSSKLNAGEVTAIINEDRSVENENPIFNNTELEDSSSTSEVFNGEKEPISRELENPCFPKYCPDKTTVLQNSSILLFSGKGVISKTIENFEKLTGKNKNNISHVAIDVLIHPCDFYQSILFMTQRTEFRLTQEQAQPMIDATLALYPWANAQKTEGNKEFLAHYCFEAVGVGVRALPLEHVLLNYDGDVRVRPALKYVSLEQSRGNLLDYIGFNYKNSFKGFIELGRSVFGSNTEENPYAFFCSELVMRAIADNGLVEKEISADIQANNIDPADLSSDSLNDPVQDIYGPNRILKNLKLQHDNSTAHQPPNFCEPTQPPTRQAKKGCCFSLFDCFK